MEEYGINLDTNMDYYKDLRGRETNNLWCETWDCLKNIIDLKKSSYFLKDKEWNDLRAERKFNYDSDWNNTLCFFEYEDKKYYYRKANLLLKLSD